MKNILARTVLSLLISTSAMAAVASPLDLSYTVTNLGTSSYDYNFTLTLDNNDSSWVAGQQFDWIIFGDAAYPGASPLTDFVGAVAPAPYSGFTNSGGGHNGPTFYEGGPGWVPNAVGDTLTWSGTSSALVGQGEMRFSTLQTNGVGADFQAATLAVPEPSTYAMMIAGLAATGFLVRRRKAA